MYDNFLFSLTKDTHSAAPYTDGMFPTHSVELSPLNDWLVWNHSGYGYKNKNIKTCMDPLIELPIIVVDFQLVNTSDDDDYTTATTNSIKSVQTLISMVGGEKNGEDEKVNKTRTFFVYYFNDEDIIGKVCKQQLEINFIKFEDETSMLKSFCYDMFKNLLNGIYSESTMHYFVSYGNVLKILLTRLLELNLYETVGECFTLATNGVDEVFKFSDDAMVFDIHYIVNMLYEEFKQSKQQYIGSTKLQRVALKYDESLLAYIGQHDKLLDSIGKCLSIEIICDKFRIDKYLFNMARLLHVTQIKLLSESANYMKLIFNMLHIENLKIGKYICRNCGNNVDLRDEFKSLIDLAMPHDNNIGGVVYAEPGVYLKCEYYDFQSCFPSLSVEYNLSYENIAILSKNQFIENILNSDEILKELIFNTNYYKLYVYSGVELKLPVGIQIISDNSINKLSGEDKILIISNIHSVLPSIFVSLINQRNENVDNGRQLKFITNYLIGSMGCRYSNIRSANFIGAINMFARRNIMLLANYLKRDYNLRTVYIDVDGLIVTNPTAKKKNFDKLLFDFVKIRLDESFDEIIVVAKKSFISIREKNQIAIRGGNNASSKNFHFGSSKYVPPFVYNVLVFICKTFIMCKEENAATVDFSKMFILVYIYLFGLRQQELFKIASSNRLNKKIEYHYMLYDCERGGDPNTTNILSEKLYNDSIYIVQNYYFYISKYINWTIWLYNAIFSKKKISSIKVIQDENKTCFLQVADNVVNFRKQKNQQPIEEYLLQKFGITSRDLRWFNN